MREIIIIVEGQTEEEFVNSSLKHHLVGIGAPTVTPILLETSPGFYGGDMSYKRYRDNAVNLLASNPNAVVTSLIDFYQLSNDFPNYLAGTALPDKNQVVNFLEAEVASDIANPLFLPYIQLHEFEGLLFTEIRGFDYLPNLSAASRLEIENILHMYPNPELINDGVLTAPSKRLKSLINRYKKTFHGPVIALENGIQPILAKCPRFKEWVDKIVVLSNT